MIDQRIARRGSTRHIRADERWCDLLQADFGIRPFHGRALVGVEVKRALALCFWAESRSEDGEERGEMIVRYCRKHEIGRYLPALVDAPELTYEQTAHERRLGYRD